MRHASTSPIATRFRVGLGCRLCPLRRGAMASQSGGGRRYSISSAPLALALGAAEQPAGVLDQIEEESEDQATLTVRCPEGIAAGETLYVTTPDLEEIEIIIPDGLEPGDEFDVALREEDSDDGGGDGEEESDTLKQLLSWADEVGGAPPSRGGGSTRRFSISSAPLPSGGASGTEGASAGILDEIEEESEGQSTLTVTCPEGIAAGDTLYVQTPDMEEIEIAVPDGVGPGEEFDVELIVESPSPREKALEVTRSGRSRCAEPEPEPEPVAFYYECAQDENEQTTLAALGGLVASGTVSDDTRVWMEGLEDWVSFAEAKEQLGDVLGRFGEVGGRRALALSPIITEEGEEGSSDESVDSEESLRNAVDDAIGCGNLSAVRAVIQQAEQVGQLKWSGAVRAGMQNLRNYETVLVQLDTTQQALESAYPRSGSSEPAARPASSGPSAAPAVDGAGRGFDIEITSKAGPIITVAVQGHHTAGPGFFLEVLYQANAKQPKHPLHRKDAALDSKLMKNPAYLQEQAIRFIRRVKEVHRGQDGLCTYLVQVTDVKWVEMCREDLRASVWSCAGATTSDSFRNHEVAKPVDRPQAHISPRLYAALLNRSRRTAAPAPAPPSLVSEGKPAMSPRRIEQLVSWKKKQLEEREAQLAEKTEEQKEAEKRSMEHPRHKRVLSRRDSGQMVRRLSLTGCGSMTPSPRKRRAKAKRGRRTEQDSPRTEPPPSPLHNRLHAEAEQRNSVRAKSVERKERKELKEQSKLQVGRRWPEMSGSRAEGSDWYDRLSQLDPVTKQALQQAELQRRKEPKATAASSVPFRPSSPPKVAALPERTNSRSSEPQRLPVAVGVVRVSRSTPPATPSPVERPRKAVVSQTTRAQSEKPKRRKRRQRTASSAENGREKSVEHLRPWATEEAQEQLPPPPADSGEDPGQKDNEVAAMMARFHVDQSGFEQIQRRHFAVVKIQAVIRGHMARERALAMFEVDHQHADDPAEIARGRWLRVHFL